MTMGGTLAGRALISFLSSYAPTPMETPELKQAFKDAQEALWKIQDFYNKTDNEFRQGCIYKVRSDLGKLQDMERTHPWETLKP